MRVNKSDASRFSGYACSLSGENARFPQALAEFQHHPVDFVHLATLLHCRDDKNRENSAEINYRSFRFDSQHSRRSGLPRDLFHQKL